MAKKLLIALAAISISAAAWASCTHQVVLINGKAIPCTTCCNDSGCYTMCH